ncbi:MAG: methyltransferase [Proteobacteria bacterium]|nr:methyltransferase [Pseudomonadota bacterium]
MNPFITANTAAASPGLVPEIQLYLATEITPLWRSCEKFLQRENIPPPFWALAWPGGQALSRYILDHPETVRGKRVLDFASGSGLVALACKKAGAVAVTANDVDPMAIVATSLNATLNGQELNVLHDNLIGRALPEVDVITAGDFCYEWPMAGYAMEWLRRLVGEGKTVLFADPGRPHAPLGGFIELFRIAVPTTRDVEDSETKSTGVFRLLADE